MLQPLCIRSTVSLRPNTITRVCILQKDKHTRPTVFLLLFLYYHHVHYKKRDQKNKIKRSACRTNMPPPQAGLVGKAITCNHIDATPSLYIYLHDDQHHHPIFFSTSRRLMQYWKTDTFLSYFCCFPFQKSKNNPERKEKKKKILSERRKKGTPYNNNNKRKWNIKVIPAVYIYIYIYISQQLLPIDRYTVYNDSAVNTGGDGELNGPPDCVMLLYQCRQYCFLSRPPPTLLLLLLPSPVYIYPLV